MSIIRTEITSEDQWHELRRPNIGASEIGALFNVHPYLTPYGLSARKLGLLPVPKDNEAMRRGRLMEGVAVQLLREQHPDWELVQPRAYWCDESSRIGCTPDCLVCGADDERPAAVIQIKSVEPSVFARDWHDDDGLVVPEWIKLQVMLEAHLTGAGVAYVAPIVVGHGIECELLHVPIETDKIDRMYDRAAIFWHKVDIGETLDPDYGRDGAALAAVYKQDDESEVDLSTDNYLHEVVYRYQAALDGKKVAEQVLDAEKAKILHRIGNAARVKFQGGFITAKTVYRKEHVVRASSFRQLSVRNSRNHEAQP